MPSTMEALERELNRRCAASPFRVGLFLKDLATGVALRRNADTIFSSASLRKISIMTAALEAVNRGRLALDQRLRVEEKYQHNDSGCLQHLTPGLELTLRDAIVLMIIVSDSTTTGMITDLLGLDAINDHCRRIGLANTLHRFGVTPKDYRPDTPSNLTTPSDTGLLLDAIARGAADASAGERLGLSCTLCALALDILGWQKIRNRLPFLLPAGAKVAHKTGLGFDCVHDAGIVFDGDRPWYVLAILLDHLPEKMAGGMPVVAAAMHFIAELSRVCHDSFREAKSAHENQA
jgi:beta-lactamase class A